MSHAGGINPDSPWLALANRKYDEEVVPAPAQPAARPPAPEPAANGTPQIPGFTSPG